MSQEDDPQRGMSALNDAPGAARRELIKRRICLLALEAIESAFAEFPALAQVRQSPQWDDKNMESYEERFRGPSGALASSEDLFSCQVSFGTRYRSPEYQALREEFKGYPREMPSEACQALRVGMNAFMGADDGRLMSQIGWVCERAPGEALSGFEFLRRCGLHAFAAELEAQALADQLHAPTARRSGPRGL